MRIVNASVEIIDDVVEEDILKKLEMAGRVCYKSEDFVKEGSAARFIGNIVKRGHESVVEHVSITVKFIVDRGVSHQIVRHRIASYSQESTRYCNYSKDKFGNEITVVKPYFLDEGTKGYDMWKEACEVGEKYYFELLDYGLSPEQARNVLPHSLKTELVVTMNIRSWRHFIELRTDRAAHPQIREVAEMLEDKFKELMPVLFG